MTVITTEKVMKVDELNAARKSPTKFCPNENYGNTRRVMFQFRYPLEKEKNLSPIGKISCQENKKKSLEFQNETAIAYLLRNIFIAGLADKRERQQKNICPTIAQRS